jgi:hypothetical protein
MSSLGPFDREIRLSRIDRRSKGGRLISQIEHQLVAHLDREPRPGERVLIQRAALLQLQLALLDEDILKQRRLAGQSAGDYLRFSEELRKTLTALGLTHDRGDRKPPETKRQPSCVEQMLAAHEAESAS